MKTKTPKHHKSASQIWQQAINLFYICHHEQKNYSRANKVLSIAQRYYSNIRTAIESFNPDNEKDCNTPVSREIYMN